MKTNVRCVLLDVGVEGEGEVPKHKQQIRSVI